MTFFSVQTNNKKPRTDEAFTNTLYKKLIIAVIGGAVALRG